jgi:D-alanyl-D-alanine carboxypeptidase/D-alanyl-D-alanine-endopeptidase (penicillin-binding protein 4)
VKTVTIPRPLLTATLALALCLPAAAREVKFGKKAPKRVKEALIEILNDEALEKAEVSFVVETLDGKLIAETGPDTLVNPASNAKLITAAAALHYLKPEFRFETEYYIRGRLKDGVVWGDLVVKGGGDPTVVTERLQRVANELYLFGVERITGAIVVDDSAFDNDLEAKGWAMEEAPDRAYAAPVSGLSFNYNAVGVYIRPGEIDKPAKVMVDPPNDYVVLEGEVETRRWGRRLRISSEEDGLKSLINVSGAIANRAPPRRYYRRIYDPPRYFGAALITFLRQRGVRVGNRVVKGKVPPGARLIYIDRSPALTEIVSDLNHFSNNFIAETLIKTIDANRKDWEEPGTFKGGLRAAKDYLEDVVGLEKETYVFGNGSGLNDVNRFSARQLVKLLQTLPTDFEIATEFQSSLAVAGTQGTIHFRFRDTPAQRRLRAKTGTLRSVSALSGYVTDPDGEILVFSILTQGYKGPVSPIWEVQNEIGAVLVTEGMSWEPSVDPADPKAAGKPVAAKPTAEPVPDPAPGG